MLFFCVADMASIDPMYQYSLSYFVSLFLRSIDAAERHKQVDKRLQHLRDYFTYFLYVNICRSLFEAHKLLFAFNLSTKLALAKGEIAPAHINFLLTGGIAKETQHANPAADVLSEKAWGEVCRLSDLGGDFSGLRESISANLPPWVECASAGVTTALLLANASCTYGQKLMRILSRSMHSVCSMHDRLLCYYL